MDTILEDCSNKMRGYIVVVINLKILTFYITYLQFYTYPTSLLLFTAFNTPTGMPYGTVNLHYGVPPAETPITCTAGCGTFIIEFGTISALTGICFVVQCSVHR